ncbi:hypothetical protein KKH27_04820 [bacterium]|nr:hypothetical protein [bacterium]MBU1983544.1 hypothetical protein [bacterium]
MKLWLVFGLTASLLYGLTVIFFKLLTAERFLGGQPGWVLAGVGLGIAACGTLGAVFWPTVSVGGDTLQAFLWAIPVALMNGFATLLVLRVLHTPTGNVSQLVPIYNTNTLVAFILAVLFFRELPHGPDLIRNLIGALLIVLGATLIGMK